MLACGAGAVVSHRSAAQVLTLLPAIDGDVEVTVVGRYCRHRPGVHVHRIAELDPSDVTERHGIPVTTPARTLLDIAAVVPVRQLERALAEALARRLVRPEELRALLARAPGRKGAPGYFEPSLTETANPR